MLGVLNVYCGPTFMRIMINLKINVFLWSLGTRYQFSFFQKATIIRSVVFGFGGTVVLVLVISSQ